MAAWAVAVHGAQTLEDLLTLAPGMQDLPPDVARSWDRIRLLSLRSLAGTALPDGQPGPMARGLLDELEEQRRLILTSRTFAPHRRTYDSLAAELGVGRERVRQLETSALLQLARVAAGWAGPPPRGGIAGPGASDPATDRDSQPRRGSQRRFRPAAGDSAHHPAWGSAVTCSHAAARSMSDGCRASGVTAIIMYGKSGRFQRRSCNSALSATSKMLRFEY